MKKILINIAPWQTRIAIINDGVLENIYLSSNSDDHLERIFFKGNVTKVLPGIQTAFVDIAQEKAGFLHISEIDRELALDRFAKQVTLEEGDTTEQIKMPRSKPDIKKILHEGDDILVQVSKEPVYEKGAKLTTCFTIPGRFIVLMPNIPRIGVSKKIDDPDERLRLKTLIREQLPEGMGVIIRTTSAQRQAKELIKELHYLVGIWRDIQHKYTTAQAGDILHKDIDLSLQIVRDYLDDDVEAIITDDKKNEQNLYRFIRNIAPEHTQKLQLYTDPVNIFEHYNVQKQLDNALSKKVSLKSGGSLIIETTEAMSVIDVNTGKFIGRSNLEETILKTNLEAAQEIARQLRLRNIGGLIVIDFIDMAIPANRQKLFKFFEKTLKEYDKFQSVVLKISEFGLVQMTRKRSGKTLQQLLTHTCASCHGAGFVKSTSTVAYNILRSFDERIAKHRVGDNVALEVHPDIFTYLTNQEYNAILTLEKKLQCKIALVEGPSLPFNEYKIKKI